MESRRTVLKYISGAVGTSVCSLDGLQALAQGSDSRPNIVCFVGEGLRWDELSATGNKLVRTPNMDRIGREGCIFRNGFVVNALCLPSRATMLTGMYSHTTGAVSNVEGKIPARFPLVSDLLQQAGYETAFIGKSHIEGALMDHKWDYYFGFVGQADYYRPRITEGVRGEYGPAKLYEGEFVDTLLTRKAVEWLKQERSKPFCLFLWFYAPHAPFYRPKDMVNDLNGVPIPKPSTFDENLKNYPGKPRAVADADNKIGYSEVFSDDPRSLEELVKDHNVGVEDNDRNVGAVWQELERQRIVHQTAMLLSSDHGFFLGEHHFYDKRLMYEPSIRVPMTLRYPGRIKPGATSEQMVLNLDMAPTLLDIAGLPVPADMQGKVFADRIGRIEVSATMAVAAEAAKLRAQGVNLVDFGAGEPHFPTPRHIKDAAIAAIEANFTRYTVVPRHSRRAQGHRRAPRRRLRLRLRLDEAIFTTGGKLALFNTIQILVDHGDEVILPVPYWVSFKDIIQYAGGKVVFLETSEAENFRITADAIEKAITPKTKAIILNSPSNPAGSVVSAEDLERIVHLAHERGIFLLLDECYVYLNYAGKPVSGGSFTWAKEHIVILGSLSKTYAMTGWRAGFALASKPLRPT
jgi:arylsulfatase A-like enzyme